MMVASLADCRYALRAYCCSENPRSFIVRAIYTIAEKASDLIAKTREQLSPTNVRSPGLTDEACTA